MSHETEPNYTNSQDKIKKFHMCEVTIFKIVIVFDIFSYQNYDPDTMNHPTSYIQRNDTQKA